MKPTTRRERVVGRWIGKGLAWLARRARDRGDWHEFNHCIAGWRVGDSEHPYKRGRCPLDADHAIDARWNLPGRGDLP